MGNATQAPETPVFPRKLKPGDEIRVGTVPFVVDLGDQVNPENAEGIAATCKLPGVSAKQPPEGKKTSNN